MTKKEKQLKCANEVKALLNKANKLIEKHIKAKICPEHCQIKKCVDLTIEVVDYTIADIKEEKI